MASGAPFWGEQPDPGAQARGAAGSSSSLTASGNRLSLDAAAQLQPKPKRVSGQSTNTNAPTESTTSPFASPTSSYYPDQGLAPRPPSFSSSAVAATSAGRPRPKHERQTSQDSVQSDRSGDDAGFSDARGSQEPFDNFDDAAAPPPAAPDVPKGPPLSYRPPFAGAHHTYSPTTPASPQTPRSVRRLDIPQAGYPMDHEPPEQYYVAPAAAAPARVPDGRSRIPADPATSPRTRRRSSVSGGARPQLVTPQRPQAPPGVAQGSGAASRAASGSASGSASGAASGAASASAQPAMSSAEAGAPRRRVSAGGSPADRQKKFDQVRSPLQKLELTLDSITKEEKRARMEAAEQAARERQRRGAADRFAQQQPPPRQYQQEARSQARPHQQPPQPQQPPQQQQVRFRDHALSATDSEPRPLLQPDMSPVEESYQPVAAHRIPLSEYPSEPPPPPPDSEKPRNRRAEARNAGPGPGIPQRNLSFRERAARNDVRLPEADGLSPALLSQSAATSVTPQRQSAAPSAKLQKDPSGDPRYNRRTDADRRYPAVQTRAAVPSDAIPRTMAVDANAYAQGYNLQDAPALPQSQAQQYIPAQFAGKLAKAPSQRRQPAAEFTAPDPSRQNQQMANGGGGDGTFNNNDGNQARLRDAAAIGATVGSGGVVAEATGAGPQPPRRTARFEDDVDDNAADAPGPGGRGGERHFDSPHHHRISNMVYHSRNNLQPGQGTFNPPQYLDEWKQGTVGTLSGALLDLGDKASSSAERDQAWWEKNGKRRGSSTSGRPRRAEAFEGEYDEANGPSRFKPPLHLVCGPLLRYCGIRKENSPSRAPRTGNANAVPEREFWRGTVMIVTRDTDSSYDIAPTLRLFVQPLDVLPPPPSEIQGALSPEYVDPLVGHPKLGRNGETLYVRPVEHLEEAKDLSRDETDAGLFEKTKSAVAGPAAASVDLPGSFAARLKKNEIDGEKVGKFKDVRGFRLHAERGVTFWRFNVEVELQAHQQRIAYRINRGPSTGFWVPAKDQPMHIMFYSCNGFSLSVDPDQFSGPDPLWRDVLNNHQTQPFHVMIGGGDQLYNDAVMKQTKIFQDWLAIRNPITKGNELFTPDMQDEVETFYLNRYSAWFSQGLFSLANSQIPMVNMYDDHDIIDGFGSYPHHFMNSPVFAGLGNVAFKYYMLFQHQSVVGETEESEPSWILGRTPGPYIEEVSRSVFMHLGAKVALLAVDCRTERTRDEVLQEETWKRIIDRCYIEIERGKTEHLLVQLGIPIAYPRLVWLENILTSRLMEPVKLLGKAGILGNFLNRFDGGVEILDDLDDHWTARRHKTERKVIIEDLQDLAADKSVRVTILSGDVHLAAVGQFYSNPKQGLAKHKDFRYIPNVISSAIANTPPPDLLADVLNKRNKIHHFDKETDEDMIPLFAHGVDGKPRNNKTLLPHRNWCSIQPYSPGTTPAPTPQQSVQELSAPAASRNNIFSRTSSFRRNPNNGSDTSRPPPSGGMLRKLSRGRRSVDAAQRPDLPSNGARRSFSLSRNLRPNNLIRRLSSRRRRPKDDGGINGTWGPDSDEDIPQQQQQRQQQLNEPHEQYQYEQYQQYQQYQQYKQHGVPPVPPKVPLDYANAQGYGRGQQYGYETGQPSHAAGRGTGNGTRPRLYAGHDQNSLSSGEDAPGAPSSYAGYGGGGQQQARIRGGAGSPSAHSFEELENGDEHYFSVRQRPAGPSRSQSVSGPVAAAASGATLATSDDAPPPTRPFYRTPTGLSAKQMKRAHEFEVNLEGGLEIRLNVEVNPKDPSGITVPYRLVVPRLWYTEPEAAAAGGHGAAGLKAPAGLKRLLSLGGRKAAPQAQPPPAQQIAQPVQAEVHEEQPQQLRQSGPLVPPGLVKYQ